MNAAGQKGEEPFCKDLTLPTPHKSVPAFFAILKDGKPHATVLILKSIVKEVIL